MAKPSALERDYLTGLLVARRAEIDPPLLDHLLRADLSKAEVAELTAVLRAGYQERRAPWPR